MPNERILVIDDDASLRREAAKTLADAGYIVETAANAKTALALARDHPFDLLLTDIRLPDLNGIQALRRVRQLHPDCAGIVITAAGTADRAMEALRSGFTGLLLKPFVPEQLLSAVVAALEQEALRRENARLRALVPLFELSRAFTDVQDLDHVLRQVLATARQETRSDIVSLMLLDEEAHELSVAAAEGLPPEIIGTQRQAVGKAIAGYVALRGEPLMIADDVPLAPQVRASLSRPELGSALSLPLKARGQVIGVLNLSRLRDKTAFTRSDLELATVLAGQAAVAIDQARLLHAMRHLSDASQRLAGALDLAEVAEITLQAAAGLAQARRAALWLVEELSSQLALYHTLGMSSEERARLEPPVFVKPGTPRVSRRGRRGALFFPISRGDTDLGLIELYLPDNQRLPSDHEGILRTLANTAAAVIESHRLRAREVIAFREIDSTLRGESNLQSVLERLIHQVADACGATSGAIFTQTGEGDEPTLWVQLGSGAPEAVAREVIATNRPLLRTALSERTSPAIGSLIGAPLTIGSRVEGAVVLVHPEPRRFGQRHLNLLSVLASSAALIVRNAQLYAWSEEKVIAEERARMAREIHDGLAQDINFLLMRVQTIQHALRMGRHMEIEQELGQLIETLRRDLREVRQTIFALRPVEIETLGFIPALQNLIQGFGVANELEMQFAVHGLAPEDGSRLPPKLQSAIYRLTQESLNNIRKHANATTVWVTLEFSPEWATLTVRDDGKGFDPASASESARLRGSVGMTQMRERAERAGGTFDVTSAPGKGTIVTVRLPAR